MQNAAPRVSRETRMLFLVVVMSIAVLWVLARIRFPERVQTPNPVGPVLAQLVPPSPLESISDTVARLDAQLDTSLLPVDVQLGPHSKSASEAGVLGALRFRDDIALTLTGTVEPETVVSSGILVACDRPTTLCVVRVPDGPAPPLATWSPRQTESPRFLFAATVSRQGISFRPLFVGALYPTASALWPDPVWVLPLPGGVAAGTFLFNADGAFVGVAAEHDRQSAIVPADTVLQSAERLAAEGNRSAAYLGIEVQTLTPRLAAAIGPASGVVVSWVDPSGPAAGQLRATDVVEQVDAQPVTALDAWISRIQRLNVGQMVTLAVRRGGDVRSVQVKATPKPPRGGAGDLGLTLRSVRGTGVEITRVMAGSAADLAGLEVGDVITIAGDLPAPNPAQLGRLYGALEDGRSLIVGVTRGDEHRLVALDRAR